MHCGISSVLRRLALATSAVAVAASVFSSAALADVGFAPPALAGDSVDQGSPDLGSITEAPTSVTEVVSSILQPAQPEPASPVAAADGVSQTTTRLADDTAGLTSSAPAGAVEPTLAPVVDEITTAAESLSQTTTELVGDAASQTLGALLVPELESALGAADVTVSNPLATALQVGADSPQPIRDTIRAVDDITVVPRSSPAATATTSPIPLPEAGQTPAPASSAIRPSPELPASWVPATEFPPTVDRRRPKARAAGPAPPDRPLLLDPLLGAEGLLPPLSSFALLIAALLALLALAAPRACGPRLHPTVASLCPADVRFRLARPG